jgi:hypothetical protein
LVSHHHGRKPGPEADEQRRGYDYGRGAYYMKHVLDRGSRRVYLSRWYWDTRQHVRDRRLGRVGREVAGATTYALHSLFARRSPSHAP